MQQLCCYGASYALSRHAISPSSMSVWEGGWRGGVGKATHNEYKERLRGRLLSFLEMYSRFLGIQSVTRHNNVLFCKKLQSRDW